MWGARAAQGSQKEVVSGLFALVTCDLTWELATPGEWLPRARLCSSSHPYDFSYGWALCAKASLEVLAQSGLSLVQPLLSLTLPAFELIDLIQ